MIAPCITAFLAPLNTQNLDSVPIANSRFLAAEFAANILSAVLMD
jgi:hypothetical protein